MITKDTKINDLIEKYPAALDVLQQNGVGCVGCFMAHAETIGQGLSAHGLDADDLINKMNGLAGTEKKVASKKKK